MNRGRFINVTHHHRTLSLFTIAREIEMRVMHSKIQARKGNRRGVRSSRAHLAGPVEPECCWLFSVPSL